MKLHYYLYFFIIFNLFQVRAQNSIEVTGSFNFSTCLTSDRLPFWQFTNSQGFLNENSDYGVSAFAKAQYKLKENHNLSFGIGAYFTDGFDTDLRRRDLYLAYENKYIEATLGAKSLPTSAFLNSLINDNILFTGNARALPGLLLSTSKPIPIFQNISLEGEIGHYYFNDDRSVSDAKLHYKKIKFNWLFRDKSSLQISFRHYVQWAGTQSDGTKLPSDFNAFIRTFTGANGGDIDNDNEAINALGNHLGTYELAYLGTYKNINFKLYHHTLFEDRSGRELNNFPDGVWGVSIFPKASSFIENFTYEYIQTISQSGRPTATEGLNQQSGGDNYFINSIYRSGWTYNGIILGLPLINPFGNTTTPASNRVIAHHFGMSGTISKVNYKVKGTYQESLGTYARPIYPRQRLVYTSGELTIQTKEFGSFTLYGGADFINNFENTYAVGVGYEFNLK